MTEKIFAKCAGFWTFVVLAVNLIYVPYLIMTTSGGEQAPLTFIVKSIAIWGIGGGLLLICFILLGRKQRRR